ncbi:MAG: Gfo/Idh/MocA family oxidoreductase [Sedimentisphaerales bacterium]|nr:Gfo/Idh/MocA family oxidoreductase [Sedimentisphaerales bacterium]
MKKLRTAVIGAGKMGRLHSRIYSEMDDVDFVGVVDSDIARAEALAKQYGAKAFSDFVDVMDKVDAVTVSVPTEFHAYVAEPFLAHGIAVLVEKPIADTLPVARRMLRTAREHDAILQVGHSERFNPVVQAMRRIEIKPRFMEVDRISPYSFRSTDIGVVLDMMIHDIDIVLSLAQSPVKDVQAAGVNVLGQHEDIANVRVVFESGCVANLTASRLALKTERQIRVFSEDAYLSLDYFKKSGVMVSKAANIDMVQLLREHQTNGELDIENVDWTEMVNVENLSIDDGEPLRMEQEDFVSAVLNNTRPQVSAEDGVAAMELVERILEAIASHRWEGQDSSTISAQQWHSKETKSKKMPDRQ